MDRAPAIAVLYALAALLAAFVSLQNVVVSAIVPNLVDRRQLRGALALEYGLARSRWLSVRPSAVS